ncbi:MAG TPA: alpha/beta fold hydrolase [Actinopolymorphaceae bacterium]
MAVFLTLLGLVALLPSAGASRAEASARPTDTRPVLLVHGWLGSPHDFTAMKHALAESGRPVYTIHLLGQENVSNAHAIADRVDRIAAEHDGSKVDLVGHSMGGLSTRYYVARLGGSEHVHGYVSMGTSHYGYEGACALPELLGGQMCPDSRFLTELDRGDDTPGSVAYTTIWSTEDTVESARLDGGACFHQIADVPHAEEPRSPEFIAAVRRALEGDCPGEYVELPIE